MRSALIAIAAIASLATARLIAREILRLAATSPLPDPSAEDVFGDHFTRSLVVPVIPIAVFTVAGVSTIVPAQSFQSAIVGLLATATAMALVLQPLCAELLLWSHRAVRMDPERESTTIERLRRAGALVNEVWVSPSPIVVFWRFSLLAPATLVRSRALVWRDAQSLPPANAGGLVLAAPVARYWPWALWPLGAALILRLRDPYALVPWWLFAIPAVLVALVALPDLLAAVRLRQSLRTDAGARDEIRGALALGSIEARLAAARAVQAGWPGALSGILARWSAGAAWQRALKRARKAARVAGIPFDEVAGMVRAGEA